jgi:gliding motility-associated protein GldM
LKFGEAEGAQIPKTNFVLQGDSFKSTIFIAAKQDGQDPEIFVGEFDTIGNGVYAMRGEEGVDYERVQILNGKGMFATRAKSEGVKSWGGLIITKTETGDKYYPFEGEYMVASKQAVASPTNMNILYIAVDNPIKIAVAGYPASQVTARSRNGTVKVVNRNKGEWIANPKKRNDKNAPIIDLYVTVDGKSKLMGSVEFKVKEVPEPLPKAARIARSKKSVSKGELRAAQMLIAEMQDFYFDRNALSYKIVSYRMNFTTPKGSFSINAEGARFNEEVLTAINNSVVGSTISFTNLKAKRSGVKKPRDLNVPVVYTIK